MTEEVFFFLRLDLLLLLHCRLRLLNGKLLEHLAIVKFALCHFVLRGSIVHHVIQFLGHHGQSGPHLGIGCRLSQRQALRRCFSQLFRSIGHHTLPGPILVAAFPQAAAAQYTFQRAGR